MEAWVRKIKFYRHSRMADGFLSGEAISGELGISRSAVWKAINGLREMGYEIDSVTNRGYRLAGTPDILTEESIRSFLTGSLISEVHALKTVDSTNNEAKRWAQQGAPHGSLFVADEQTGGKGGWEEFGNHRPEPGYGFLCCCGPRQCRSR